ncbi:P-selectin-like isoform X1 [Molossus molossus]|uniref:p-selectin n=2 Tax=Molossus molossus TaxID=27622 RepID=A0A7J8CTV8_MOLMO|nr:P-selectin-like isoform X1 [Molossus molossus]KAF6414321.1 selectin P [Molossus molossus]
MACCLRATRKWTCRAVVFRIAQLLCLSALISELVSQREVAAWTYHYDTKNLSWPKARNFCREHYTDLVAIQNKNEIAYLNDVTPYYSQYYWIGIRKINDKWTWVGTNKTLTPEAENWADHEPNNRGSNQDCVEIYIKSPSAPGKWNDEPCRRRKRALCYSASCQDASCSRQGECVETIGNYTCSCHAGFYGPECEHALQCQALPAPHEAQVDCVHPFGAFRYQSTCSFTCREGSLLVGANELQCLATGSWSAPPPQCRARTCTPLLSPRNGMMTCVQPLGSSSYQSTCHFTCDEGFSLSGPERLDCTPSGHWSGSPPTCEGTAPAPVPGVRCPALIAPMQGNMSCRHYLGTFGPNTACHFECTSGFTLRGEAAIRCTPSGQWTAAPPACRAVRCSELHTAEPVLMDCSHPWGNFSYGSACTFGCPEGQSLNGSATAACQPNGQWSAAVPTCQEVPLTTQEALTYFGGAVASTTGLVMGGTLLALLRRRCRQKDDGKSPLNPHSHLGTYGVFTNAAFDPSP